jgi:diguanylate cyclase (GGDEF)-like protein
MFISSEPWVRERGGRAGDTLLRRVALALLSSARDADVVARVGGDKFAVLLPDTDGAGAAALAERLAALIARTDMDDDDGDSEAAAAGPPPLRITISVGVAAFEPGIAEDAALMAHAEDALLRAKREMRGDGSSAPGSPAASPPPAAVVRCVRERTTRTRRRRGAAGAAIGDCRWRGDGGILSAYAANPVRGGEGATCPPKPRR